MPNFFLYTRCFLHLEIGTTDVIVRRKYFMGEKFLQCWRQMLEYLSLFLGTVFAALFFFCQLENLKLIAASFARGSSKIMIDMISLLENFLSSGRISVHNEIR